MGTKTQTIPRQPLAEQIVTPEVLRWYQALDISAFSGVANPTTIWQAMLTDSLSAYKYYRDIEEKDAHVSAMLDVRKDGLLRRKHQIVASSDAPEDKARAEFIITALKRLSALDEILDDLADAPAYGVTIAEILWEEADGQVWVKDIITVPQEFFSFGDRFDRSQSGPLRFIGSTGLSGEEVPEHKFLVHTFRPRNGNRRGRPLLRRVFWFSWAKRQVIKFMLQHAEKGTGTVAVKYPAGASEEDKTRALEAAQAISDEAAVAIPENFQIVSELLEKARTGSVPDYLAQIERLDSYITRQILGQTLTTAGAEQGAGSRALGEVHERVRFDKVVADAERLERVLNDQLIHWLLLFNYGPGVPLPKYEIDKSEPVDLRERIGIDRQLVELGVEVPLSYAKKTYSIPEPQPGEELLQKPIAPQDFGFPGATP